MSHSVPDGSLTEAAVLVTVLVAMTKGLTGASKISWCIEVHAAKSDILSSILRTPMVDGENQF